MPLLPETLLDDIQARVDIAQIIGQYVPLKRAGRHFKALCPFHKERTPSFHINTDKQIFHCFGCGVGGNVFSFLMQQDRLTFPEAVRQLAQQVGVTVPEQTGAASNGKTQQLVELMEKACAYYERMLAHPTHGRTAREYLRSRGVSDRTRQVFRLGYAPGSGTHLLQAAKQAKIVPEALEHAGLTLRSSRGVVDRFRERLVFPIIDARGRVVGFGGRSLQGQEPKYLNSPETPLYTKGRQLYGLWQAKDAMVKRKLAVVVEGYFDGVLLWQAGIAHVVSPSGTAFTPEQAKLLARYTDQVILAFDADAAGETAALRGMDVLVEAGFQVSVAQLPAGVDPDEFVRAYGLKAFEGLLDKALNVVEFLLACAARQHSLSDPDQKVRAAQGALATVARVPDAMRRREYVRLLAQRLHLDERAVLEELEKTHTRLQRQGPNTLHQESAARGGLQRPAEVDTVERLFSALLLDDPSRFERIVKEWELLEQLKDSQLRGLLMALNELRAVSPHLGPAQLISRLQEGERARLVAELVPVAQREPAKDEAFRKCVERLRHRARAHQQAQMQDQLRVAQELGRDDEVRRLLMKLQHLMREPMGTRKKEGSAAWAR